MLKILIILVLLLVIFLLRHALVPLCVGITIAYILNPFVDYLEKKFGGKRFLCVIVSYLAVITAVAFDLGICRYYCWQDGNRLSAGSHLFTASLL